jgi:ankyrin repeat protein
MRLLDTRTLKLKEFDSNKIPQYAILSHTWRKEEITYQDIGASDVEQKAGYDKVKNTCSVAAACGDEYVWIDTCCIDKTNSVELSEAINSMYRWYQQAKVCYAYLADVSSDISDGSVGCIGSQLSSKCRWFARGWTLQELIAPSKVIFLNHEWQQIGTKSSLQHDIFEITGIPVRILSGDDDLETASIAQRMSWAANRNTSKLEDRAYCLMGIFGIDMPLLYGEGQTSFVRLQEEIMKVSDDYSIFAWKSEDQNHGGLLATSPDAFEESADITVGRNPSATISSPLTITNIGIQLELSFIGIGHRGFGLAILHCTKLGKEDLLIAIYLRDISLTMERFERVRCGKFELIDLRHFRPSQYPARQICVRQRRLAIVRTQKYGLETAEPGSDLKDARPNSNWELFDVMLTNFVDVSEPAALLPMPPEGRAIIKLPLARSDTDTNLADEDGRTPLSHAAGGGHVELVRSLLAQRNVKADSKDKDNRTPLSYAAGGGHAKVVWLLLAQRNVKADSKDKDGRTPLSHAAGGGHNEVVWLLLARSDIEPYSEDGMGQMPLSHAAKNGHKAVINMFLARKDVRGHLKDGMGRTLLSHASEGGQEAVVEMFLTRSDIEPDIGDNSRLTPLSYAAAKGHQAIVKLLLDKGADVDSKGEDGRTPLSYAAANGHYIITELLLDEDANVDSKGEYGHRRTPLSYAAENGRQAIVELLLDTGKVDVDSKGEYDRMPLSYATANGYHAIVELITLVS